MADGIDSKTKGLAEISARMERLAGTDTFSVRIGMNSTQGTVRRKHGPVDVSRNAGENVTVLRTQALDGRDIAFLSDDEQREGTSIWRQAVRALVESTAGGGWSVRLEEGAKRLGDMIVAAYRQHIERSQGRTGPVKPVLPSTQRQKDREVGPGKPPLERTGQLLRAWVATLRRL